MNLTNDMKESLHTFYLGMRQLSQQGIPRRGIQRSFEELLYSVIGRDAWRPTHITKLALKEYVEDINRKIQRAHGAYEDRLDRFDRTLKILEGPELSFDKWWKFFLHHDKTVLMTRSEHGSGGKPAPEDLVELPPFEEGLFENSGFNARIRKTVELRWMKDQHEKITGQKNEK